MDGSTPGFPVHHQLPELAQTQVHRVRDAIQPSVVPFSSCLQLFPESGFFHESILNIRWSKYWKFSFSGSPSNEYSGLISCRIDYVDLLAVQETLKTFFPHHSSKALIFWHSAFFMVQLSHPYLTTGKTTVFTRWAFVRKVCLWFLICCLGRSQRRRWHPTPVLLPGKSHGRRSLVGCSPWGR